LGIDNETANHVDRKDTKTAVWIALGTAYHIALPEFEKLVELRSGDVMTFDASKVLHSLVAPRTAREHEHRDIHCCVSLYTNGNQIAEVAKLSSEEPLEPCVHTHTPEQLALLSQYELTRLDRIQRNKRKLQELGLPCQ